MWRPYCDSSSRGLTLIEVLLSATLILAVFGLGASFLIPLLGMHLKSSENAELEQRSTLVVEDLRRDLSPSAAAGLSLVQSEDELLLGIHKADDVAQDGTLVWRDSLVIHHWTRRDGQWKRLVWTDPTRTRLRAAAPTRLDEAALREAARTALVLRTTAGWRSVQIQGTGALLSLPLVIRTTLATPSGASRELLRTLGGRLPAL